MQINSQSPIRPVPTRRKTNDKLDVSQKVSSFEDQVQAANPKLRRRKREENTDSREDRDGGIDVTA